MFGAWLFLNEEHINVIDIVGVVSTIVGSLSVGCSFVYARRLISPLKLPAIALATYQIGLALIILLLVTSRDGIGAVFQDTLRPLGYLAMVLILSGVALL